jgi:hypothetical protein
MREQLMRLHNGQNELEKCTKTRTAFEDIPNDLSIHAEVLPSAVAV